MLSPHVHFETLWVVNVRRAVEHAMREVARHLKIRKIGQKKIPLEYAQWGDVCGALNKKIAVLQQLRRGPKKAAGLNFYSRVVREIEWFNEVWRKNVAHARTFYNRAEAENAMIRARDFFQLLATKIKEKN